MIFSYLVANFIDEITAADDSRNSNEVDGRAVVNMAIATSYASIYRNCSEKTEKRNIGIPSYSWFLFQF